ncbi:hypothetical protein [Arthrobacter sp. KK5.5]|uniref:hypothetical protein n=1 Tax=Arthrobacter sp. KK5.5 TaxID=3373084 RepID=UPI003EE6608C
MRLLLAVLAILLGAAALVLGIGQRTFWSPPETATATLASPLGDAPLTVVEPGVAGVHPDAVDVTIEGDGEFLVALGRSEDVDAWVGDAAHNTITGVDTIQGQLFAEHTKGGAEVPNPAGSDLWVDSETADGELVHKWTEPAQGDWSLLLAADGKSPAPTSVTVSWPNDAGTPFAIPLIIAGSLLLVLGLALTVVAGRGRGGRGAKGTSPAPATAPLGHVGSDPASGGVVKRGAAVAVAAVLAMGSATPAIAAGAAVPNSPSSSSDSATAEPADGESGPPAVLLDVQLERILASVSEAVSAADSAKDAKKLADRVTHQAHQLRETNYDQRADGLKVPAPAAVAEGPLLSAAVTTSTEWPRTVVAVTKAEKATVPQVLTLTQADPRSNYKLVSSVSMLPGSEFPGIAVGDPAVTTLPTDAKDLRHTPEVAAARLAGYLSDPSSKAKDSFADSVFITATHEGQDEVAQANEDASIEYSRKVAKDRTTAVSTPDGGAIVTAYLTSTMTAQPKEDGGTVALDDLSAELAGASTTQERVDISYAEPVVFYIPAAGSKEKIRLVAGDVLLMSAKVAD